MLTAEQVKKRSTGIGGSELGVILGVTKWATPLELWLEKTGRKKSDFDKDNDLIYWGNVLEPVICDEFSRRNGVALIDPQKTTRHKDPALSFMLGTPDRLIVDDAGTPVAGLEVKTANAWVANQWAPSMEEDASTTPNDLPLGYVAQCAHYMEVFDLPVWHLAVLIGGSDYRQYTLPRDAGLAEAIIRVEQKFWQAVEDDTPPAPSCVGDVRALMPQHVPGKRIAVNGSVERVLSAMPALLATKKKVADEIERCKTVIAQYMATAEILENNHGETLATFKTQSSRRIDSKRLKNEQPAIYAAYSYETPTRRVLVK